MVKILYQLGLALIQTQPKLELKKTNSSPTWILKKVIRSKGSMKIQFLKFNI